MDTKLFVQDDALAKIHKNVAIAKSGIYQYHVSELSGLFDGNVEIPAQHKSRTVFNVMRPPEVLKDAKNLFVRLPLTREHPDDFVTAENIRDDKTGWIGWTGDSSSIVLLETDKEVTINSTLNIVDKDGLVSYDQGIREVSPGYVAKFMWKDGKDKNGTDFQIVMTKIEEVNHLALVDQGRGGKDASILDKKFKETEMDKDSVIMSALKKLFGAKEKVLDSMPKNIEKFNDEQRDYLLKETHRLLMHRVSGKSFDSFMPIGYTQDDLPEPDMASDSSEAMDDLSGAEKAAHEKIAEGLKEDEKEDKKEEGTKDDADVVDSEDMTEDGEKEDKEEVADDAEKTASSATETVEPVKTSGDGETETLSPQASARDSITVKVGDSIVKDSANDPFAIMNRIRTGFANKKETK